MRVRRSSSDQNTASVEQEDEPPDKRCPPSSQCSGDVEVEGKGEGGQRECEINGGECHLHEAQHRQHQQLHKQLQRREGEEEQQHEHDQQQQEQQQEQQQPPQQEREVSSVTTAVSLTTAVASSSSSCCSDGGSDDPLPPVDIYYSSHPAVRLRPCDDTAKGLGLFAIQKIKKGEIVWRHCLDPHGRATGKIYTKSEIEEKWKDDLEWFWHWAYRCGEDAFLGPITRESPMQEATYYQNHSCEPSTWWVDETTLVARRDIEVGEEITYDYGTSESDETEIGLSGCLCGSGMCRGEIKGNDHLRPELIERYGCHFQPYLRERVKKHVERVTGAPWVVVEEVPKKDDYSKQ